MMLGIKKGSKWLYGYELIKTLEIEKINHQ